MRAGWIALLGLVAQAARSEPASFRDLGSGFPSAISADGSTVLGRAGGVVLWHADGTREVLGSFGAPADLSADASVVVGVSSVGSGNWIRYEPWRWTREGGLQPLGPFPDPFRWSFVSGLSDDGWVFAGGLRAPNGPPAPFVWTLDSGITALPVPGGVAYAISGDGRFVVGEQGLPFRFDRETQVVETLSSLPDAWPEALATSRDGSVSVGWMQTDMHSGLGGDTQAVRWTAGGNLDGLGFLEDHWETRLSRARAVSGDGSIVVGSSLVGPQDLSCAFVWDPLHGMRDLREELETRFGLAIPWRLDEATDVSADGRTIVGWSGNEESTRVWVVVLPPGCDDGIDDDGDGLVDLVDPGCSHADDLSEGFATSVCGDGIDDDEDGAVDFPADPGCSSAADASETAFQLPCDDAQDNDRDGLADSDDPGCDGPGDPSERSAIARDDGIDNDGDGMWDVHPEGDRYAAGFPSDPSCFDPAWPRETSKCADGLDNDGDGGVDAYGGPGDEPPDAVCAGAPWRDREAPSACGVGFELVGLAALAGARRRGRARARGRPP
jgi:uncharacterized membrane protein